MVHLFHLLKFNVSAFHLLQEKKCSSHLDWHQLGQVQQISGINFRGQSKGGVRPNTSGLYVV